MRKVGVVGCGQMGSGIAEVFARAGMDVVVVESDDSAAVAGRERIARSLRRAEEKAKITSAAEVSARIDVGTDLSALAECELVTEAIVEDPRAKIALFAELDELVASDAILASNTSAIPIASLGAATKRPGSVIGMHFFNPVPVLDLVEVIPSISTAPETVSRVCELAQDRLGKKVIVSADRAGFVVNALLLPFLLSAIRMFEAGFATAIDIDEAMVRGCAHPQGPLALADLIGLDTVRSVAEALYEEFKEPLYAPPPLLSRMVQAGQLGRKTGRGFHTYEASS